jgi:hypothetical protein
MKQVNRFVDSSPHFGTSLSTLADKAQFYPSKQKRDKHLDRNYNTEPGQINFFDMKAQTQITCMLEDEFFG